MISASTKHARLEPHEVYGLYSVAPAENWLPSLTGVGDKLLDADHKRLAEASPTPSPQNQQLTAIKNGSSSHSKKTWVVAPQGQG
jgi:hypothetical protein